MKIAEIDHIHLYVEDIAQAEQWYNAVLGFSRDVSLGFWAEQGGPRVIRNNRASLSLPQNHPASRPYGRVQRGRPGVQHADSRPEKEQHPFQHQ